MTFFAMAESKNNNSLFLDSDQDGLTNKEEQAIGSDLQKTDTDGDGYSDSAEIRTCYNPLAAAPGDKMTSDQANATLSKIKQAQPDDTSLISAINSCIAALPQAATQQAFASGTSTDSSSDEMPDPSADPTLDLTSDPNNPNLTNEMIGQLLEMTKNKATSSDSFVNDPTFSSDDLAQVSQSALQTVDITKDLPDIKDSELNILPEISDKKLSDEELKTRQKDEITKYLAQVAFIFASNSPFPVEKTSDLGTNVNTEAANLVSALSSGDQSKIDSYASKAQAGIDQLKKVAVPFALKDIHKSMLQLAIYTLNQKDNISINSADPMKSLAAVSSLQAVAQNATSIEDQLSEILSNYGITEVSFP